MKHVFIVNDKLYRELEAASIVLNCPVETAAELLLKDGIAARQSSPARCVEPGCVYPAVSGGSHCRTHKGTNRHKAVWPPEIERRSNNA
jgi:hypothetical protein